MCVAWKISPSLGCYVDNESMPLKILFIFILKSSSGTFTNSCLPLRRAYLFTFMQESVVFLLVPTYSLVGKHCVLGKDQSIYGHANIFDHELLLLTIINMINKLGCKTLSPNLSLCSMDAICSNNML